MPVYLIWIKVRSARFKLGKSFFCIRIVLRQWKEQWFELTRFDNFNFCFPNDIIWHYLDISNTVWNIRCETELFIVVVCFKPFDGDMAPFTFQEMRTLDKAMGLGSYDKDLIYHCWRQLSPLLLEAKWWQGRSISIVCWVSLSKRMRHSNIWNSRISLATGVCITACLEHLGATTMAVKSTQGSEKCHHARKWDVNVYTETQKLTLRNVKM